MRGRIEIELFLSVFREDDLFGETYISAAAALQHSVGSNPIRLIQGRLVKHLVLGFAQTYRAVCGNVFHRRPAARGQPQSWGLSEEIEFATAATISQSG
jgi:hypothetical protein